MKQTGYLLTTNMQENMDLWSLFWRQVLTLEIQIFAVLICVFVTPLSDHSVISLCARLCPTPRGPVDCSPSGSSVCGILWAGVENRINSRGWAPLPVSPGITPGGTVSGQSEMSGEWGCVLALYRGTPVPSPRPLIFRFEWVSWHDGGSAPQE